MKWKEGFYVNHFTWPPSSLFQSIYKFCSQLSKKNAAFQKIEKYLLRRR